jgi:hypothetical protein
MSDLIDFVIDKHDGLQRWDEAAFLSAEVRAIDARLNRK